MPKPDINAILSRVLGAPALDLDAIMDGVLAPPTMQQSKKYRRLLQDSDGPVTAWRTQGAGLVLNDATFPIEVASYLWKGERAFFQAAIRKPQNDADRMVRELWLRQLPESERTRLRSWCPADVVMALTVEAERRTGKQVQWTAWIMPLAGSPYYKFHPEAMEKVLAHSAAVCPEPCEIDLSDPAFESVQIAQPATEAMWIPTRPLASTKSTRGRSQENIATWVNRGSRAVNLDTIMDRILDQRVAPKKQSKPKKQPGRPQSRTVLYVGMADDVLTPFLLVPEARTVYAIDLFDNAFSSAPGATWALSSACPATGHSWKRGMSKAELLKMQWESQKADILKILAAGNDAGSHYRRNEHRRSLGPIMTLGTRCRVLSSSDDGKVFRVHFRCNGIDRQLVYFHHRNYYKKWPKEVQNITDLISIGAPFDTRRKVVKEMVRTRTTDDLRHYFSFDKKTFFAHMALANGTEDVPEKIRADYLAEFQRRGWLDEKVVIRDRSVAVVSDVRQRWGLAAGSRAVNLDTIMDRILDHRPRPFLARQQRPVLDLWVEPYAGLASAARALHSEDRGRPITTYQGGKHPFGGSILGTLGLFRGGGAKHYWLNDAGPSAFVIGTLVDPATRDRVLDLLAQIEPGKAAWAGTRAEGRAWWRLAEAPVPTDPATFAAVWLALQMGSWGGKPVGVDGSRWKHHGYQTLSPAAVRKGFRYRMNPPALAKKLRRMESSLVGWPVTTTTGLAIDMPIPDRVTGPTVVFLDPPYVGLTGYLKKQTRKNVRSIALRWHDAGAMVVIAEAARIDLGRGETHVLLIGDDGRPRKKNPQWLTVLPARAA